MLAAGFCKRSLHHSDPAVIQSTMTRLSEQASVSLARLGWSTYFDDQLEPDEDDLDRMRIATVHRTRLTAKSETRPARLSLPVQTKTSDFAVGYWVLVEPGFHMLVRRLDRHGLLKRQPEVGRSTQLIAANVNTLFIVTSCNEDFDPARLERYLALANEAGTTPVVVLTKIDQTGDAAPYLRQAKALKLGLVVVTLNAKAQEEALTLVPWCGPGQTVAFVGSSGVGKSTLVITLSCKRPEDAQLTGPVSGTDSKGRHIALASCDCRWRLRDRHARNANPACQRSRGWTGHALCGNSSRRVAMSIPGLHSFPRARLRRPSGSCGWNNRSGTP